MIALEVKSDRASKNILSIKAETDGINISKVGDITESRDKTLKLHPDANNDDEKRKSTITQEDSQVPHMNLYEPSIR